MFERLLSGEASTFHFFYRSKDSVGALPRNIHKYASVSAAGIEYSYIFTINVKHYLLKQ